MDLCVWPGQLSASSSPFSHGLSLEVVPSCSHWTDWFISESAPTVNLRRRQNPILRLGKNIKKIVGMSLLLIDKSCVICVYVIYWICFVYCWIIKNKWFVCLSFQLNRFMQFALYQMYLQPHLQFTPTAVLCKYRWNRFKRRPTIHKLNVFLTLKPDRCCSCLCWHH